MEIAVGPLIPPAPHRLPMLMRDYGLDLHARWAETLAEDLELIRSSPSPKKRGMLTDSEMQAVSGEGARTKDPFVIVDAVGVCDSPKPRALLKS